MPVILGNVAGRQHGVRDAKRTRIDTRARGRFPIEPWEAAKIEFWKTAEVGDERIALRLMRPVWQISGFDPVRPNGRRRDG